MEKTDTGLAKLDNCTKHALIHSPPKSLTSQKACNIECHVHTCHSHPATDNETIFTAMIIFQDVLNKKRHSKIHYGNGQMKGVISLQKRFISYNWKKLTRWTRWFLYRKYHNLLFATLFKSKQNEKCSCWDKNCWLFCCEFCRERKLLLILRQTCHKVYSRNLTKTSDCSYR